MPRVRAGAFAIAAAVGSALAGAPLAALAQSGEDYPRVVATDASRPPQVTLDVVVPPLLAGPALPPGAFRIVANGRPLPISSATQLSPAKLRVLLVLDTRVDAATLAAQQGAARDFVFQLAPEAEVGVVAPDPEPDVVSSPGTDREEAIRALVGLRTTAQAAPNTDSTLELALSQLPAEKGTGVVVVVDSRPSATAAPAAVTSIVAAQRATVYSIVLGDPAPGYLGGLAQSSGGRVLQVDDTQRMLSAYDVVINELRGRYRLVFQSPQGGTSAADLVVSARGVTAATGFTVAPTSAAPGAITPTSTFEGSTRKRTSGDGVRLLAGVLLGVLLLRLAWRVVRRTG